MLNILLPVGLVFELPIVVQPKQRNPYSKSKSGVMVMGALSPWHIILVAAVALLIFGPNKLPELGRGVGKMFREFKDVTTGNDTKETIERKEIAP